MDIIVFVQIKGSNTFGLIKAFINHKLVYWMDRNKKEKGDLIIVQALKKNISKNVMLIFEYFKI